MPYPYIHTNKHTHTRTNRPQDLETSTILLELEIAIEDGVVEISKKNIEPGTLRHVHTVSSAVTMTGTVTDPLAIFVKDLCLVHAYYTVWYDSQDPELMITIMIPCSRSE
jgi:hypothetical protein